MQSAVSNVRDSPKSDTLQVIFPSTRMFRAARSRWTNFALARCLIPRAIPHSMNISCGFKSSFFRFCKSVRNMATFIPARACTYSAWFQSDCIQRYSFVKLAQKSVNLIHPHVKISLVQKEKANTKCNDTWVLFIFLHV